MIAPDSQLAEMGLVPQEDASGLLAHVDAVEAFLCRARVRLRLGDGGGARADAASARGMACPHGFYGFHSRPSHHAPEERPAR
ncbi:unnamed protein product [Effrenium voratum]|nr:unnamed protein product [Effrenium voratum]